VADFRQLPYGDASIDVVVIDPPYTHCGHYLNNDRYGSALTSDMRYPEILELYRAGMKEAQRVLRRGGTVWIKFKNEVGDGRQNGPINDLPDIGKELGFERRDLFTLIPRLARTRRHQHQRHALKRESYLWVFQKRWRPCLLVRWKNDALVHSIASLLLQRRKQMKSYIAFRVDSKTYDLVVRTARVERRTVSSLVRNIVDRWAERRSRDHPPRSPKPAEENATA
jgi:hypothetical protein